MQLGGGHGAAVASDAAGVAAGVGILEAGDGRKVEGGECAGFSQGVSRITISSLYGMIVAARNLRAGHSRKIIKGRGKREVGG